MLTCMSFIAATTLEAELRVEDVLSKMVLEANGVAACAYSSVTFGISEPSCVNNIQPLPTTISDGS